MGTREAVIKDALPVELWPAVLDAEFEEPQRNQFQAQAEAMRLYFAWVPVAEIERRTGISRNSLARLARRCLKTAPDGRIQGFRACIPFLRTEEFARRAQLATHPPSEHGGMVGALRVTLERFPDLEGVLVKFTKNEVKRLAIPEHKLRACDLHRIFLRCLAEKGVGPREWPFTTKYRGLRSIQQFMRDLLDRNFSQGTATREASEARAHLSVGRGVSTLLNFDEPFDAVEIDSHRIQAHLTVAFRSPEGLETDVRLDRLNLIAAVDRFSSAVLAYKVVYRPEINADDILKVIRDAAAGTWGTTELTIPNLSYPEGGGLPSGVIEEAKGALWSATLFDGALAHLASAVHSRARAALGFAINWGPVAHFERRPNVERLFKQIDQSLFRRLPSTTGSHPRSGRADEAERKAVEYRIRAIEVEQLLDVTIAQYNATPSEDISFLSPLEAIRYYVDRPERFECRKRPMLVSTNAGFQQYESATVRGNRVTGRRPYIQVDRVHYTNEILANSGHLIGIRLLVEIDEDDMRQVKAFLSNGAELGVLKAHGKWGGTKHSRRTRKAINSLITKRLVVVSSFDDPVQVYLRYLATPSKKRPSNEPNPRQASEIVRIKKEIDAINPIIDMLSPIGRQQVVQPSVEISNQRLMPEFESEFFTKVKNRR